MPKSVHQSACGHIPLSFSLFLSLHVHLVLYCIHAFGYAVFEQQCCVKQTRTGYAVRPMMLTSVSSRGQERDGLLHKLAEDYGTDQAHSLPDVT